MTTNGLQESLGASELYTAIKEGKVSVVDVRTTGEFRSGHIAGSLSIPMDEIESRLADVPAGRPVVMVCHSGARSEIVRNQMEAILPEVTCLDGGLVAWEKAGHTVVRSVRTRLALDRQAMIGASAIILASVALGAWVAPGWFYLALLPGAGLMTAGTTGFCLMASILKLMPWNKARS